MQNSCKYKWEVALQKQEKEKRGILMQWNGISMEIYEYKTKLY